MHYLLFLKRDTKIESIAGYFIGLILLSIFSYMFIYSIHKFYGIKFVVTNFGISILIALITIKSFFYPNHGIGTAIYPYLKNPITRMDIIKATQVLMIFNMFNVWLFAMLVSSAFFMSFGVVVFLYFLSLILVIHFTSFMIANLNLYFRILLGVILGISFIKLNSSYIFGLVNDFLVIGIIFNLFLWLLSIGVIHKNFKYFYLSE